MTGKCSVCGFEGEMQKLPFNIHFEYCVKCYNKAMEMFGVRARFMAGRHKKLNLASAMADTAQLLREQARKEQAKPQEEKPKDSL